MIYAVGFSVVSAVYKALSVKAMNSGNAAKSATYQKSAVGLDICVAPFDEVGIVGGVGTFKGYNC